MVSDFKKAFSGIFDFTVGILFDQLYSDWSLEFIKKSCTDWFCRVTWSNRVKSYSRYGTKSIRIYWAIAKSWKTCQFNWWWSKSDAPTIKVNCFTNKPSRAGPFNFFFQFFLFFLYVLPHVNNPLGLLLLQFYPFVSKIIISVFFYFSSILKLKNSRNLNSIPPSYQTSYEMTSSSSEDDVIL